MSYWSSKSVVDRWGWVPGSHVVERRRRCARGSALRSREYDLTKESAIRRLLDDAEPDGLSIWLLWLGASGRIA